MTFNNVVDKALGISPELLSLMGPQGERMHVRARPRPAPSDAP